jgi:hypothetical protein
MGNLPTRSRRRWLRWLYRLRETIFTLELIYLLIGLLLGILVGIVVQSNMAVDSMEWIEALWPEGAGIVFTVLFLDRANHIRQQRTMIRQLVRRAQSRYAHTALVAIEELRVEDQLWRGVLAGRSLRGANWRGANLYRTDLRGSDLTNVQFEDADLTDANLTGAKVTHEQLERADRMRGAILRNGQRYDGRYVLEGDVQQIEAEGILIDELGFVAKWYGVTEQAYVNALDWHRERDRARLSINQAEDEAEGEG